MKTDSLLLNKRNLLNIIIHALGQTLTFPIIG
jgi:hypothetical protein